MSGADPTGLAGRFRDHLAATGVLDGAARVVVAVSGGVDSMTLLHLLRFGGAARPPSLHAAHMDHRMRAGSAADADWLGEVCAGWGVKFHLGVAAAPVRTEAEGRERRYAFLAEVAEDLGGGAPVLTGHTADDQAETVLFRIARGSGPRGLGGIRAGNPPGPVRPLLPFRRAEVEAYAAAHEVPHREDPTNRDPRWTRNRIRHEILPLLEEAVPGAAAALAALAGTSRVQSAALDRLLDERIAELALAPSVPPPAPGLSFDRKALAGLPDPVLAALLRRAAARLGGSPGRAATAALLRFVREAPSGRRVTLRGGVTVRHDLGRIHFRAAGPPAAADRAPSGPAHPPTPRVRVEPPSGEASFTHGACTVGVSWRPPQAVPPPPRPGRDRPAEPTPVPERSRTRFVAHLAPAVLRFPLDVRPWAPGDRITLPYGKKKVNKLLLEARIPKVRREGWPVVADAAGAIVWVPGSAAPALGAPSASEHATLRLEVRVSPPTPPAPPGSTITRTRRT